MKKITKFLTATMAFLMASSAFVGCGGGGSKGNDSSRPMDLSKTQLWIYNQGNATGSVWLDNLITRFEAEYANKEFANGTTGIQVQTYGERTPLDTLTLADKPYQIVFTEGATPAGTYDQSFLDMTNIVTEKLPGEERSIADKLSEDTKAGLTVRGGYYLLPHFESYATPTYNKHLFDAKGFYFADSVDELYAGVPAEDIPATTDANYGILLKNKTAKKSCGPDGVYNTEDDGLPSSIEEYKQLVSCLYNNGTKPFVAYASTYHYTNKMLLSLWATLEGYNGVMHYVSGDGAKYGETEIVKLDSDNNVLKNPDGTPQTEKYSLTDTSANSDGYKIERQASKYYALDLFQHIFSKANIDKYYDTDGLSSTTSHTDVQRKFLEGEVSSVPVAFLMDGSYWENESKDAGNLGKLKQDNPEYYDEMDYRLMHLPTQYKGRVQAVGTADAEGNITYVAGKSAADIRKQVLVNSTYLYMYVNKAALLGVDGNIDPSVLEATKLFIQFMYTDKSLSEATALTGMARPMDYEVNSSDLAKMSKFARNTWNMRATADVVNPIATSELYKNNSSVFSFSFQSTDDLFSSQKSGNQVRWAINGFRSDNMSVDEYFKGITINRGASWWKGLVR